MNAWPGLHEGGLLTIIAYAGLSIEADPPF
jgi:hypothetical protein